eukprot:Lankesteria_metandrocarpae@DN5092_c1_g1_i4.p1
MMRIGSKYNTRNQTKAGTTTTHGLWAWIGRMSHRPHESASVRDTSAEVSVSSAEIPVVPPASDTASDESKEIPVAAVTTGAMCGVAMLLGVPLTVWLATRGKNRGYIDDEACSATLDTSQSLWSGPSSVGDSPEASALSSNDGTSMPCDEPVMISQVAWLTLQSVNYGHLQTLNSPNAAGSPEVTNWFKRW